MIAGDLIARLRLDGASKFLSDLQAATTGVQRFAGVGKTASAALGTIGNVVNTAGAAIAVLGTKAVAAGANFNRLQQNSGVALKTLLGSSEAAQRQLEKLNAFTAKSPFGRDTFMKAQQTLLGFGVEAEKVIPYLDGIQNAVAGIGGSNADIEGIAQVIAKIRSSATLGQQDLLELGNRGINAAALIADATGKTEQQVRDSIFGNPLRGEEALAGLDAMMSGMSKRFAGTTDELKKQMDGARDRVKAAMRDIGAVISAPVIDPKGGGWGVRLTNSYADILRGVQSAITPMVAALQTRLGPTVLQVDAHLQRLASTIRQVDMADLRAGFEKLSPILPAVASGLAAVSAKGLSSIPILSKLGLSFNPLVAGLLAAAAASPTVRAALADLGRALSPLGPVVADVARILAGQFSVALNAVGTVLKSVAPVVELVAKVIASIPAPVLAAGVAFAGFGAVIKPMLGLLGQVGAKVADTAGFKAFNGVLQQMTGTAREAYAAGLSPMSAALAGMGPGVDAAKAGFKNLGGSIMAAFGGPVGLAVAGVTTAVTVFTSVIADAERQSAEWRAGMEELAGTLDKTTGAVTASTRSKIADQLMNSEWKDRVYELVDGQYDLAEMTRAVTGESTALTSQLEQLVITQVGLDEKLRTGSHSSKRFSDVLKQTGLSAEEFTRLAAGGEQGVGRLRDTLKAAGYDSSVATELITDFQSKARGINFDALKQIYGMAEQLGFAQDHMQQLAATEKQLAMAGSETAAAQLELREAIRVTSDSSADASERLRALWKVMDLLNGGTLTAAEQQQQLDDAIRSSAAAFEAANEASGGLSANLLDAAGNIDTSTEAGSRFRTELEGIRNQMGEAGIAAANLAEKTGGDQYTAALKQMQPYVDEIRQLGKEYGLSEQQMQGLLESVGLMPDEAALALTLDGADDVDYELASVALQLRKLEDGHTITMAALTDDARAQLEALGFTVKQLDDGSWEIDMGADTAQAEARVQSIFDTINGAPGTVKVDADTTQATRMVESWKDATDQTAAITKADADTAEAEGKVLAWKLNADNTWSVSHMDAEKAKADATVITWKRDANNTYAVAHVGANAGTAYSVIRAYESFVGRSNPRVNVGANTGSAQASINRLDGQSVTLYVDAVARNVGSAVAALTGRADGGLDVHTPTGVVEQFASGGFPTGIYRGGTPIYKFAEPETGWEAFVSGRRGQERRNLRILEEAQQRLLRQLGMPRVRRFADGGITGSATASSPEVRGDVWLDGKTLVGEFVGVMTDVADRSIRRYDSAASRITAHGRGRIR
ncbi:tape measure protein [Gulosibacter hominis]|uniref:tape measure protein n=1 Tax=Gulosibacter hominis TaxID=2770504 RepID=UPI001918FC3C|nr:tape measure protein [Gulosibacter hominis]